MVYMNAVQKNYCKGRTNRAKVFCEKGVLKTSQNSQKNTCAGVSVSIKLFCENFKKTFFNRTPLVAPVRSQGLLLSKEFVYDLLD